MTIEDFMLDVDKARVKALDEGMTPTSLEVNRKYVCILQELRRRSNCKSKTILFRMWGEDGDGNG